MAKYNWTVDTLTERLHLINKILKTETDPEKLKLLKYSYDNLEYIIYEFYDYTPQNNVKLLESYDCLKNNVKQFDFLWPQFQDFYSIVNKYIDVPRLKRHSLSSDDILSITHDFYKSLNKFFFGNFMKNFSMRKDHIIFRNSVNGRDYGSTITIPGLNESFIEIFRENTIDDVITTIHEYSHATSISINPYNFCLSKGLYKEIDSIFMELVAFDYLENLFHDNNSTILKSNKINELCNYADDLTAIIDIIEAEPETGYINNKHLKQIVMSQYEILPREVNFILNNFDLYSAVYLTSFMFALELYKLYKEDKEKALYYLKKIILLEDMSEEEYYCNIKRFGFIPNLSLQDYFIETQKDAASLTRKKSNS